MLVGPPSLRLALFSVTTVVSTHLWAIPGFIGTYEGIQLIYLGRPKSGPGFNHTSSSYVPPECLNGMQFLGFPPMRMAPPSLSNRTEWPCSHARFTNRSGLLTSTTWSIISILTSEALSDVRMRQCRSPRFSIVSPLAISYSILNFSPVVTSLADRHTLGGTTVSFSPESTVRVIFFHSTSPTAEKMPLFYFMRKRSLLLASRLLAVIIVDVFPNQSLGFKNPMGRLSKSWLS